MCIVILLLWLLTLNWVASNSWQVLLASGREKFMTSTTTTSGSPAVCVCVHAQGQREWRTVGRRKRREKGTYQVNVGDRVWNLTGVVWE